MLGLKPFNDYLKETEEIGFAVAVMHCIANIEGLPGAHLNEIIVFENGDFGRVLSLGADFIEVLILSEESLKIGTKAARTNSLLKIPVTKELLGKCVNPFGQSINDEIIYRKKPDFAPIDIPAPGIDARNRIKRPFETGVSVVDIMVPLGKGQRELIIGDRHTGKGDFLIQAVMNQVRQGTICIYCAIGKRKLDIKKMEESFIRNKVMDKIVLVATSPEDPTSSIFIAPYCAMTIAEYFKDRGNDVFLILDDLTNHAKFYREISLLGKRFPGRNSYPGDIFYTHARLLERAGNFITPYGEKSITCFPIAETTQGDLSGYIQTNIMSMTDGHIFFDSDIYYKGRRPAINISLSVSRVGKQTQTNLLRAINTQLNSFFSQHEKVQNFVHFGAELNENIKNMLNMGDKVLNYLNQDNYAIIPVPLQIFLFSLLWSGLWQKKSPEQMKIEIINIVRFYESIEPLRKIIDNIIKESESVDDLIKKVKDKVPLLKEFNIHFDGEEKQDKKLKHKKPERIKGEKNHGFFQALEKKVEEGIRRIEGKS